MPEQHISNQNTQYPENLVKTITCTNLNSVRWKGPHERAELIYTNGMYVCYMAGFGTTNLLSSGPTQPRSNTLILCWEYIRRDCNFDFMEIQQQIEQLSFDYGKIMKFTFRRSNQFDMELCCCSFVAGHQRRFIHMHWGAKTEILRHAYYSGFHS